MCSRSAEHPLALFLDDLQWLDGATLDLLESILVDPEPQHLLLVGAYRNNEVDAAHPLMRTTLCDPQRAVRSWRKSCWGRSSTKT